MAVADLESILEDEEDWGWFLLCTAFEMVFKIAYHRISKTTAHMTFYRHKAQAMTFFKISHTGTRFTMQSMAFFCLPSRVWACNYAVSAHSKAFWRYSHV